MSETTENFGVEVPGRDVSFLDLVYALLKRWKLLCFGPLGAGLAALAFSYSLAPTYTATVQLITPQNQAGLSSLLGSMVGGGVAGALAGGLTGGLKNPADQWIGMLKSNTVRDALIEQYELRKRYNVKFMFEAREVLARASQIEVGKDGLIDIAVDDSSPEMAAALANSYVIELGKLSRAVSLTDAALRRKFFEEKFRESKEALARTGLALRGSGIEQGLVRLSPEASMQGLLALKAREIELSIKVDTLRGSLTEAAPELRQAIQELSSIQKQLAVQYAPPDDSMDSGYTEKYRDFKFAEALFELTAKQYELARVDEATSGAIIQVIDTAKIPEWKSSPRRGLMAVATSLIALFACISWIIVSVNLEFVIATEAGAQKIARIRQLFSRTK